MICALVIVFVGSVAQAGGVENTVAFLNSLPGFLNGTQQAVPIVDTSGNQLIVDGLPAFGEPTEYGIIAIISCLAWGLGYFGMPQVLVRFMSVKIPTRSRKSPRYRGGLGRYLAVLRGCDPLPDRSCGAAY